MDNFRQGDLTDIVRASAGGQISSDNCTSASAQPDMIIPTVDDDTWQFPSDPMANIFCSMPMIDHIHHRDNNNNNKIINNMDTFGDPFSNMRDPLLHELNMLAGGVAYYDTATPNSSRRDILSSTTSATVTNSTTGTDSGGFRSPVAAGANNFLSGSIFDDHNHVKSNIFSRIQISTSSSQSSPNSPGIKAPVMLPCDMINISSPKGCLLDHNNAPVQISSPRNLGIKRRKSQAKKVVCIPAAAAANSRSTGEVVPSDLWAWRKYGQKPIKGSPYPRGYYRCSSSKGCSARKQVERSRTDPNMLVITYTSEHNHPWPTQRNALAGSTRSQPSKGNNISNSSLLKTSTKEEMKESSNDTMSPSNNNNTGISVCSSSSAATSGFVKEELDKHLEMDDSDDHQIQFSEGGFSQSYRPELPGCEHQQGEDFFADLDEIEPDSLNLLYTHGFGTPDNNNNNINKDTNKAASVGGGGDPFSMFDWSNDDKNTN